MFSRICINIMNKIETNLFSGALRFQCLNDITVLFTQSTTFAKSSTLQRCLQTFTVSSAPFLASTVKQFTTGLGRFWYCGPLNSPSACVLPLPFKVPSRWKVQGLQQTFVPNINQPGKQLFLCAEQELLVWGVRPSMLLPFWVNSCLDIRALLTNSWLLVWSYSKTTNRSTACIQLSIVSGVVASAENDSVAMIHHSINVVKQAVTILNPGQVPVIIVDQPVHTGKTNPMEQHTGKITLLLCLVGFTLRWLHQVLGDLLEGVGGL